MLRAVFGGTIRVAPIVTNTLTSGFFPVEE